MIYIEVSDTLNHFTRHKAASGIQRVAIEVTRGILEGNPPGSAQLVTFSQQQGGFVPVSAEIEFTSEGLKQQARHQLERHIVPASEFILQHGIVKYIGRLPERGLKKLRRRFASPRKLVQLTPADTLLLPGANWAVRNMPEWLAANIPSCQIVQIVYDLIPVRHPEFFDESTTRRFCDFLRRSPRYVSRYVVTSEFVASDLRSYLRELGVERRIDVIPLVRDFRIEESQKPEWIRELNEDRLFALMVGTIEVRKNHLMMARIWSRLIQECSEKVPYLIIAGRRGWLSEEFFDYMAEHPELGNHVRIQTQVSDEELAWLYRNAKFTVMPSLDEGWGLPVGEAAACGTPTICSNSTALPEVLGVGVCDTFDPRDENDIMRVVKAYVLDETAVARARDRLKEVRLRTWRDVADDFTELLRSAAPQGRSASDSRSEWEHVDAAVPQKDDFRPSLA